MSSILLGLNIPGMVHPLRWRNGVSISVELFLI
jgi:hypothetical protein